MCEAKYPVLQTHKSPVTSRLCTMRAIVVTRVTWIGVFNYTKMYDLTFGCRFSNRVCSVAAAARDFA
eukprot:1742-Eustigmatos_ZCMA.PRE.1